MGSMALDVNVDAAVETPVAATAPAALERQVETPVIARNPNGGPSDVRYSEFLKLEFGLYSKQYFESQLAVALGGRLAEEIVYGDDNTTTGASNDIQQVARYATMMVSEWGMSDKVGSINVSGNDMGQMEKMMAGGSIWGDNILKTVEQEVERLTNNSYLTAKQILLENRDLFEELTEALMEREVVTAEEFQMMLLTNKSKTVGYELIGQEKNREKLPFQELPASI